MHTLLSFYRATSGPGKVFSIKDRITYLGLPRLGGKLMPHMLGLHVLWFKYEASSKDSYTEDFISNAAMFLGGTQTREVAGS